MPVWTDVTISQPDWTIRECSVTPSSVRRVQEEVPHIGSHYISGPSPAFAVIHQQLCNNFQLKKSNTTRTPNNTKRIPTMTRTHKWTVHEGASEQRYFTHNGHADMDPNKVRKDGNGKFNWGKPGDELNDQEEFAGKMFGQSGRRNSNHAQNENVIRETTEMCDNKMK